MGKLPHPPPPPTPPCRVNFLTVQRKTCEVWFPSWFCSFLGDTRNTALFLSSPSQCVPGGHCWGGGFVSILWSPTPTWQPQASTFPIHPFESLLLHRRRHSDTTSRGHSLTRGYSPSRLLWARQGSREKRAQAHSQKNNSSHMKPKSNIANWILLVSLPVRLRDINCNFSNSVPKHFMF